MISSLLVNGQEHIDPNKASATTTPPQGLVVAPGAALLCVCQATDVENDPLTYTWSLATSSGSGNAGGSLTQNTSKLDLASGSAPMSEGNYVISCAVTDDRGGGTATSALITVVNMSAVHPPTATLAPTTGTLAPGATQTFICTAKEADSGVTLTYSFFSTAGSIVQNTSDPTMATYTAPTTAGTPSVYCIVSDGRGDYVTAVSHLTVKTP